MSLLGEGPCQTSLVSATLDIRICSLPSTVMCTALKSGLLVCVSLIDGRARTGLTKVPIDGQPKSIVQDLENMARTYIKVTFLCMLPRAGSFLWIAAGLVEVLCVAGGTL